MLHDYFAGCSIINLPERTDRRREKERELARADIPAELAEFYPAIRPDSAGDFPSLGARGCFHSHLGVLRQARDRGWSNVLIMEDDLAIDPRLSTEAPRIVSELQTTDWDMAYLGHVLRDQPNESRIFRSFTGPIATAHFFAVHSRCLSKLVLFLETVLSRPAGHADGGPMHVDGAYSTFRLQNPDLKTLVASPSLGSQRSSRSDITPGWKDRIPVLRTALAMARSFRNRRNG